MRKKINGFTLVELLVVVTIIAILSTLIVVYFNTAKMTARDSRRLSDVQQIQLALKMYYSDVGIYPTAITAGNSIANGGTNYLLRIPANPSPRSDNGCADQEYQYKQLESGQRYSLSFCLGDQTDTLSGGTHTATANGILNCASGYIPVPGSYTFNTNDFCVMKYEAKCALNSAPTAGLTTPATGNNTYDNGTTACTTTRAPVSVSSGYPIGNISEANAATYCANIGGHLMTNAEWMTIARNIEQTSSNWNGGVIGTSWINRGNYTGATVALDGTTVGTSQALRTHTLSNGETMWDLSGNVSEWLADTCSTGAGTGNYHNSGSLIEWTDTNFDDYERGAAGPTNSAYNDATNALGRAYTCPANGRYFVRGGYIDTTNTTYAGIFQLDQTSTGTAVNRIGFRCVK
jgi:prepilin-type N-terminal cleavage/methylation domain-containing protein